MSQSAKAQEPSMEEILASIRRIIADDEGGKPKAPEPAPVAAPKVAVAPAAGNSQDDIDAMLANYDSAPKKAEKPEPPKRPAAAPADVLDLTEAMTAAAAPPPPAAPLPAVPPAPPKAGSNFRTIDASSDVVFAERTAETPAAEPAVRPAAEEPRRPAPPATPSLPLDRSLLSNAAASAVDSAFNSLAHTVLGNNARTLEDLVKEMLRPMLKAWLDDNLPGLVERIVRAEIERVSRGGR